MNKNMDGEQVIIGVNYADHDASIFAVGEDKQVFGLDRERVTRHKHDGGFPHEALDFYLKMKKPSRFFLCHDYAQSIPSYQLVAKGSREYHLTEKELYFENQKGYNEWLGQKKKLSYPVALIERYGVKKLLAYAISKISPPQIERLLRKKLIVRCLGKNREYLEGYAEYDHHYCHAVCAYTFSGFKNATIVTLDGKGDFFSSKMYTAKNDEVQFQAGSDENHSIGLLYNSFTKALGFRVNSDEGKVEALAAYGRKNNQLYQKLKKYVVAKGLKIKIKNPVLQKWFDPSVYEAAVERYGREDCAAAVQQITEDIGCALVQNAIDILKNKTFAFGGGVFANVIMNMHILERTTIKNAYIVHAMGDSGGAAGAAFVRAKYQGRDVSFLGKQEMPYFGPAYSRKQVLAVLKKLNLAYVDLGFDWPEQVAKLIAQNNVVGIFHGRMEFGPRALGNRSVLANPTNAKIKDVLNNTIKKRASFQPFCPSILESERRRLFKKSYSNKLMTCAFRLREEFWKELPAIIHVDGTARPQFVEKIDNLAYFRLLKALKSYIGFGVVLNTSFNLHGRTMVMSPEDAVKDFLDCGIRYMCIEGFLVKHPHPCV